MKQNGGNVRILAIRELAPGLRPWYASVNIFVILSMSRINFVVVQSGSFRCITTWGHLPLKLTGLLVQQLETRVFQLEIFSKKGSYPSVRRPNI